MNRVSPLVALDTSEGLIQELRDALCQRRPWLRRARIHAWRRATFGRATCVTLSVSVNLLPFYNLETTFELGDEELLRESPARIVDLFLIRAEMALDEMAELVKAAWI